MKSWFFPFVSSAIRAAHARFWLLVLAFCMAGFFGPAFSVFAATTITIEASPKWGSFSAPTYVTLNASDAEAKIFYTFRPASTPADMYLYTGAIRVAKSTPLLFFAVKSTTEESKIEREDYTITYPDIRFASDTFERTSNGEVWPKLNISNGDAKLLNGWTLLGSGITYTFDGKNTLEDLRFTAWENDTLVLQSPDGEEQSVARVIITPAVQIPAKSKPQSSTVKPTKNTSTSPVAQDSPQATEWNSANHATTENVSATSAVEFITTGSNAWTSVSAWLTEEESTSATESLIQTGNMSTSGTASVENMNVPPSVSPVTQNSVTSSVIPDVRASAQSGNNSASVSAISLFSGMIIFGLLGLSFQLYFRPRHSATNK